jgi:hypothetical protein
MHTRCSRLRRLGALVGVVLGASLSTAASALTFDFVNQPLTIGPDSISITTNGVTATARAYHVEFANGTSTIHGPFTTGTVNGRQIFGTDTSGVGNPGLGLTSADDEGQQDTDVPSGGLQPGFDNFPSLPSSADPRPSIQFLLISFDAPVDVSQVVVDDVSNFDRDVWVAAGPAAPVLTADLVTAFSGFEVVNSGDDASDGIFVHTFSPLKNVRFLAIGTALPAAIGDLGPFARGQPSGSAQFYINALEFEPSAPAVACNGDSGAPCPDHFVFYQVKPGADAPRFVKFGPVTLADQFRAADYDVLEPEALGLPADKNGEGVADPATHLVSYKLKTAGATPAFEPRAGIRAVNQCGDLLLEVRDPRSLLVPAAKDEVEAPPPPDPASHEVDHFLCYDARPQRRLADGTRVPDVPRGIQVDVEDQFQVRRYDLTDVSRLCTPVAKSGEPVLLSGPDRGTPRPLAPAAIRNPVVSLLCYEAKAATRHVEQEGCGPADPGDRGTLIAPRQEKHVKRTGIHVANQFGAERHDTVKEIEVCVPTILTAPPPS